MGKAIRGWLDPSSIAPVRPPREHDARLPMAYPSDRTGHHRKATDGLRVFRLERKNPNQEPSYNHVGLSPSLRPEVST